MPADEHIICIHQGEDGTVCGHDEWDHSEDQEVDLDGRPLMYGVFPFCASCVDDDIAGAQHPFTPGRKCPTCDGSGKKIRGQDIDLITGFPLGDRPPCPTCADSPVRGYQEMVLVNSGWPPIPVWVVKETRNENGIGSD